MSTPVVPSERSREDDARRQDDLRERWPRVAAPQELSRVAQALAGAPRKARASMAVVADRVRDEAIELARRFSPQLQSVGHLDTLTRRPDFIAPFKRGLAVSAAKVLGPSDVRVMSIYSYDLSDPVIHLLVLVSQPTLGLQDFGAALDKALAASIDALRIPECFECERVLDIHQITPKEVRLGLGYAALLSSVSAAPLKIWDRMRLEEHLTPVVWHLSEVAETVRVEAIDLARQAVPQLQSISQHDKLVTHPAFSGPFKCGLATCVAKVLGANDQRVVAVFSYDLTDPVLHLLVLVTEPTAALEAFTVSLDRALTADLHDLRLPEFAGRDSVLDVNLVTPKDVRLGIGCAALLSAVRTAPIRIWQRGA